MVFIEQPDEDGADKAAEHLGDDIAHDVRPGEGAEDGEPQGDGRIEVGAGNRAGNEDARHDGEAPSEGDDDPPRTLGFTFVQGTGGADSVAQQHEHERADQFKKILCHNQ